MSPVHHRGRRSGPAHRRAPSRCQLHARLPEVLGVAVQFSFSPPGSPTRPTTAPATPPLSLAGVGLCAPSHAVSLCPDTARGPKGFDDQRHSGASVVPEDPFRYTRVPRILKYLSPVPLAYWSIRAMRHAVRPGQRSDAVGCGRGAPDARGPVCASGQRKGENFGRSTRP